MKKFYILLVVATLLAAIWSYYLITQECLRQHFDIIKDVLSVVQVVVSIFLVYLLYDRFGTSKKILDKQNELIINFLEELKKVHIEICDMTEKGPKSLIDIRISKNLTFAKNKPVSTKIALFHIDQFYTELKIINQLIEHPLFPVELKNKADIFKFGIMTNSIDVDYDKYGYVSFTHKYQIEDETWMYPFDGDMTINDYLIKIENAVEGLEKWINKETSITINLNLN